MFTKIQIMKLDRQFTEIHQLICNAKARAFRAVNTELINLYWEIGKYISNKIANQEWGKGVVKNLSDYLNKAEPDLKGFSSQNLWRMKQFYEAYHTNSKLSPLVREISWTNNMIILSKSKTTEEREFYIRLSIKERLSKRELERQIDRRVFERIILSEEKLSPVVREIHPSANQVFKDNYILDFLSLPKKFSEKNLRKSIIENFKNFILEFGKDFAFVGEEYRIQVGKKDFYIDLVFFHRELQCLVAIDLKITDFKPEYLGKMEFYLEALDRQVKKKHEKPSVGLILCKSKDSKIVEYALSRSISPTLISQYETKLIDKKLLEYKLDEFFELGKNNEQ
jgi:predicted nuclease of restriction endonuclease-like (RecB) superfamily